MPRARIATVAGLIAIAIVAALVIWQRSSRTNTAKSQTQQQPFEGQPRKPLRRLDVQRFREDVDRRRAKVEELRARVPVKPAASYTAPNQPSAGLGSMLTSPSCILGPGELCTALGDLIAACDGEDAASCLALGQYLEETPPRPLMALSFFMRACKLGDKAGCERDAVIHGKDEIDCAHDTYACAWRGYRAKDPEMMDAACTAGVADACAVMMDHAKTPEHAHAYLELSCQLGNPMACTELGKRLSPDCKENCYPPDAEQATQAFAIGCAAGFKDACK